LATYRYYNMDQVVGQALATFARIQKAERTGGGAERRQLVEAAE
jgi:UDP-galactopyranose mutase